MKKTAEKKEVAELTEEQLAELNNSYPVADEESNRLTLPRFGMLSKDITETTGTGKLKKVNVIQAAGTFYTEKDNGEVDEETGKKVWTREYIDGDKVNVVIVYHRRQLRRFDSSLKKFYSTPLFDTSDQVLPLYLDKQIIKKGTMEQLQAMWPTKTLKGKPSSELKEDQILFVIYKGELYQFNLSQSSKWAFKDYKRNLGSSPATIVTTLSSLEDTFGDNTFSKTTFTKMRTVNGGEFDEVRKYQKTLEEKVESDKQFLLQNANAALPAGKEKAEEDEEAFEEESEKIKKSNKNF